MSFFDTRQNIFLFFFPTKLFVICSYTMYTYMFDFGTIIKVFAIAIWFWFSLFNWISSDDLDLNYKSLEKWKMVNTKIIFMLFMLFSTSYGLFQEQNEIFKHRTHETWPWTCHPVVLKFYKTQTKSQNHETCRHVMISYVEPMIKNWECFVKIITHYV